MWQKNKKTVQCIYPPNKILSTRQSRHLGHRGLGEKIHQRAENIFKTQRYVETLNILQSSSLPKVHGGHTLGTAKPSG